LLREVGRKAEEVCGDAYFVGGCVRDLLRGVESKDVDLAVAGNAHRLGKLLAGKYEGHVFFLRQEDGAVRVLLPKQGGLQLDLCPLRGTLDEDLHARDLTINAMAVPAAAGLERGAVVIDPTGGHQDLKDRLIRFVSADSPVQDPLRTMRAFRFRWKLDFELAPGTLERIRECVSLLAHVSTERIRDELFQLLTLSNPDRALEEMLQAEVGPWLFGAQASFEQAPGRLADVLSRLDTRMPQGLNALLNLEPTVGRGRREVLLWAAALQPLGVDPGAACRHLALSNDEKQIVTRALAAAPLAAELASRWPVAGRERHRFF
jgi:tRNA nucleotidyltransferase/poly(A) polymerase